MKFLFDAVDSIFNEVVTEEEFSKVKNHTEMDSTSLDTGDITVNLSRMTKEELEQHLENVQRSLLIVTSKRNNFINQLVSKNMSTIQEKVQNDEKIKKVISFCAGKIFKDVHKYSSEIISHYESKTTGEQKIACLLLKEILFQLPDETVLGLLRNICVVDSINEELLHDDEIYDLVNKANENIKAS